MDPGYLPPSLVPSLSLSLSLSLNYVNSCFSSDPFRQILNLTRFYHSYVYSRVHKCIIFKKVILWKFSIVRFLAPSTYVEGFLFSWPRSCLSSFVDFIFLEPLGKTATIVFVTFFRKTPLQIRQYLTKEHFLTFLIQMMGNSSTMCFFSSFLSPWQETFADAGDGDGAGGRGGEIGINISSIHHHI